MTRYSLETMNKCVLGNDLNRPRVLACLILSGSPFHGVGAEKLKGLSFCEWY